MSQPIRPSTVLPAIRTPFTVTTADGQTLVGEVAAPIDGALIGLLIGVGIVGGSSMSHRIFAGHGFGVLLIEAGNDIVNLGLAGAILVALS